jgi:hypothetical protein
MSVVYILTNESMPGYIKVGRTEREVTKRVVELDNTAVPLPFQCYYAARVPDYEKVERALHVAFDNFRVRKNREFFKDLDPHKVKAILELLAEEDVTPREDIVIDAEATQALEKAVRHTRRFSFSSVGIPIGATLVFAKDSSKTCVVETDTSVIFAGESMSISQAALRSLHDLGYRTPTAQGTLYWLYNDESLNFMRERLSSEAVGE